MNRCTPRPKHYTAISRKVVGKTVHAKIPKDNKQLSPKGEVNSDSRGIYLLLFTDPEGDSCFNTI